MLPGDGDDLDRAPLLPQSLPEAVMAGAPRTQRRGGVVSRIDEDKDRSAELQCDRQLQREVALVSPTAPR